MVGEINDVIEGVRECMVKEALDGVLECEGRRDAIEGVREGIREGV